MRTKKINYVVRVLTECGSCVWHSEPMDTKSEAEKLAEDFKTKPNLQNFLSVFTRRYGNLEVNIWEGNLKEHAAKMKRQRSLCKMLGAGILR